MSIEENRAAAEGLYEAMVDFLYGEGARRQEQTSAWWWGPGFEEIGTLGNQVEEALGNYGIDVRVPCAFETEFGWGDDDGSEA